MKSIIKKAIVMMIAIAVLILPMAVSAAAPIYNENKQYALSVGTKNYSISSSYNYTIFSFDPSEEAEYTFTAGGKLMGIASYNGMWISYEPSSATVTENSITWECTSVGQSIWISVKTDRTAKVSVTVEKKEIEKEEEIPWTMYKNVHTPTPFTFTGNVADLEYVDTEDGVDDRPTLGDDGYYHFKDENGPILYVDLDDPIMNLVDAQSYGQLKYIGYDGEKIVTKIDFYDSFAEYAAKADKNTMLYPLTEDLIQLYKLVGQDKGWYGEDGWIGGTDEDYWMFACYYDATKLDDTDNDNNNGGNNNSGNTGNDSNNGNNTGNGNNNSGNNNNSNTNTNTNTNTNNSNSSLISPATGDNSTVYIAVLLILASAVAILAVKKLKN